jgi:hypothetical protein
MGGIMNDEFEDLEERLQKLVPLDQEVLMAKILGHRQTMKQEETSPARSAAPCRRRFASFSLSSALAGAILGAAATFLAMTLLVPPKVEIREVAREETGPAANSPHSSTHTGSKDSSLAQPTTKRNLDDRFASTVPSLRELDALLAEQEARVRRMARYESNFSPRSSGFVPPRISPEQYREILRELKL